MLHPGLYDVKVQCKGRVLDEHFSFLLLFIVFRVSLYRPLVGLEMQN